MAKLDKFTEAYVECALWSSTDENGVPLDSLCSWDDIDAATLTEMITDCADFQATNEADINGNDAQAGHDFWLTRNRHGAGFWDGDWEKEAGKRLTDNAHAYGEYNLTIGDDGNVYGG